MSDISNENLQAILAKLTDKLDQDDLKSLQLAFTELGEYRKRYIREIAIALRDEDDEPTEKLDFEAAKAVTRRHRRPLIKLGRANGLKNHRVGK